ncbi:MAG: hypothetical protein ACRDOO_24645 [Actinomadura sp.]
MDLTTLAALLDRDGEAFRACRHALLDGANFEVGDRAIPVHELIASYQVREAHTRATGLPTLGFAAAIEDLQTCALERVLLGSVSLRDPAYWFALFMAVDRRRVVACIGVDQDPRSRQRMR